MDNAVRIRILDREYTLRVREGDEEATQEWARYVDDKMRAFKAAHPHQSELTTAIITALALAEELHACRVQQRATGADLDALAALLDDAL